MPLCLQMPHPAKVAKCGEDTYFIANNYLTVGVFDGVGGWAFEGIDPRQYSSNFAMKCKEAVDQMSICEPKKIMEYAYNNTQNIMGSTTVVIASLLDDKLLVANLGDSGLLLLRPNEHRLLFQTDVQAIDNMPFQIGPQHAQFLEETQHVTLDVQVDDIILMATDGVWDNFARAAVSRSIIEKIKAKVKYPNNLVKLADIAFDIVKRSFEFSQSGRGKPDDITVLVAAVQREEDLTFLHS
jgi:protein phosphatase PTC7